MHFVLILHCRFWNKKESIFSWNVKETAWILKVQMLYLLNPKYNVPYVHMVGVICGGTKNRGW